MHVLENDTLSVVGLGGKETATALVGYYYGDILSL